MHIEKALQHFEWKFKNHWKPTQKDVEAFNSIIEWKELQEQRVLNENELFAKLWIEKLITLSRTKMYNGERCIQVIDEVLSKSVYQLCVILQNEIPMMRFNSVASTKYPIDENNALNVTKMRERNEKIISEFETDLTKALKYEISEDNIIKFVNKEINRCLINNK